jgi:YidC/Oxa1 family membrane protein insertase
LGFLSDNFISDFFVMVLKLVYSFVHDYSGAIIILTVAIRLLILPLDLRQKQSARKMAMIQPKLESLKKRYANNPQQLQKKQQELYKTEGVKPLAGCLPMLITLPIFFAFFGAMRVLEAEQTISFILNAQHLGPDAYALPQWLWVHNFWQPDSGLEPIMKTAAKFAQFFATNANVTPQQLHMMASSGLLNFDAVNGLQAGAAYQTLSDNIVQANGVTGLNNGWFILPILAGGSLFLQQKMTTAQTPGGAQAQPGGKFMLWFFPLFSVYICATANTAFSVYWLAANIYALGQTLIVNWIYKKRDEKRKQGVIEEAT